MTRPDPVTVARSIRRMVEGLGYASEVVVDSLDGSAHVVIRDAQQGRRRDPRDPAPSVDRLT